MFCSFLLYNSFIWANVCMFFRLRASVHLWASAVFVCTDAKQQQKVHRSFRAGQSTGPGHRPAAGKAKHDAQSLRTMWIMIETFILLWSSFMLYFMFCVIWFCRDVYYFIFVHNWLEIPDVLKWLLSCQTWCPLVLCLYFCWPTRQMFNSWMDNGRD